MTDVTDRVRRLLAGVLGVDIAKVTDDAHLADDLEVDSLDEFDLVIRLQDEFSIEIGDEGVETFVTVGDIIAFVSKATGATGA
jgi:acyl carrier protein